MVDHASRKSATSTETHHPQRAKQVTITATKASGKSETKRPGPEQILSSSSAREVKPAVVRTAVASVPNKPIGASYFSAASRIRDEGNAKSTKASDHASSSTESSSSESDSENEGKGIAGLVMHQKEVTVRRAEERRTIKIIDVPMRHNPIQARLDRRDEARRTGMRMKPDVTSLHRHILSWNYDHDGDEPSYSAGFPAVFRDVPQGFHDYADYRSVFEPLLMLECWCQLVKSKEEQNFDQVTCRIMGRQYNDEWSDIDISLIDAVPQKWSLTESDIVLLRRLDTKKSTLAKVQSSSRSQRGGEYQATLRCLFNDHQADPGLQITTIWTLRKVFRFVRRWSSISI